MKFILGLILGIVLVPVAFYAYCRSGRAPVAVTDRPFPFEELLANAALDARVERDAPTRAPFQPTDANLAAGAQVFAQHCASCHGLPNLPSKIARDNFPRPPQLFQTGQMVTDDPAGVSYWKVKHGIRLSAMRSFADQLSEEQMWQVAFLLKNADHLPAPAQSALAAAAAKLQARSGK